MNPLRTVVHACAVLLLASSVQAQPPRAQQPVVDSTNSDSREGTNQQKDWHFIGRVEFEDERHQDLRGRRVVLPGRQQRSSPPATSSLRRPTTGSQRNGRVQHRDASRHVLQRVRDFDRQAAAPAGARRRHRAAADGRPGHGRLFLRRDDREDRSRRNTRSPRAASRPACSRRRAGIWSPTPSSSTSITTRC